MTANLPLSPEKFEEIAIVSRETMDRLRLYADHLVTSQARLNLVSRNSLADLWGRHMLDSIQLVRHLPEDAESITDIGSGAGFPGLVLAIATGLPTVLVESHHRKSDFLREAAALTEAPVTVTTARVGTFAAALNAAAATAAYGYDDGYEDEAGQETGAPDESPDPQASPESANDSVDILTARALAPLDKLCEMADSLHARTCLFHKGGRWREELTEAEKHWTMTVETFESVTSPDGRILRITGLQKKTKPARFPRRAPDE